MKILVTGHRGFIGSHFLEQLPADWEYEGYDWSEQDQDDICNTYRLTERMKGKDIIFNFAGQVKVDESNPDPVRFWRSNTFGFVSVLRSAREYKIPVIHATTGQAEQYPDNHYLCSKYAAEKAAETEGRYSGLQIHLVRITNPYGDGQPKEYVIPKFIQMIREGRPLTLNNGGTAQKDFIHIDDVARGFVFTGMDTPHNRGWWDTNTKWLGTGQRTSIYDLALLIYEILGETPRFEDVSYRKYDGSTPQVDKTYWPENWSPQVSLEEGIRRLCDTTL